MGRVWLTGYVGGGVMSGIGCDKIKFSNGTSTFFSLASFILRFHEGMAVVSDEVMDVVSAMPFSLLRGVKVPSRTTKLVDVAAGLSIVSLGGSSSLNNFRLIELFKTLLASSSGEGSGDEVYDVASVRAGEFDFSLLYSSSIAIFISVMVPLIFCQCMVDFCNCCNLGGTSEMQRKAREK